MELKVQYHTEQERIQLLDAHKDKYLKEESNLINGNFLVFTDTKPIEAQVTQLQSDSLILMDALAMTFEEVMLLRTEMRGTV